MPPIGRQTRRASLSRVLLAVSTAWLGSTAWLVACGSLPFAEPSRAAQAPCATWRIALAADGQTLHVQAEFDALVTRDGGPVRLVVPTPMLPFVTDAEILRGARWNALERAADGFLAPAGAAPSCTLRWSFDTESAARALRRSEWTRRVRGGALVSPGAWLCVPADVPRGAVGRLVVDASLASRFACGLLRDESWSGTEDAFRFPLGALPALPPAVLGDFVRTTFTFDAGANAELEVVRLAGDARATDLEVFAWARACADGVARFYGRFPVARGLVILEPGGRGAGRTWGNAGAVVLAPFDPDAAAGDLVRDWILVHELVHLACPLLPARHHWFEEGISTYVEPFVRLSLGQVDDLHVWTDFVEGLPYGLPRADDGGLDETPTWGRTYWGGALFCLLADMRLRAATGGRHGLRAALSAVVAEGWSIAGGARILDVLEIGDRALGVDVLVPLYEELATTPRSVDLAAIWARLGIERVPGGLALTRKEVGSNLIDLLGR